MQVQVLQSRKANDGHYRLPRHHVSASNTLYDFVLASIREFEYLLFVYWGGFKIRSANGTSPQSGWQFQSDRTRDSAPGLLDHSQNGHLRFGSLRIPSDAEQ